MGENLEKFLAKAIKIYNKYRSPESTASLMEIGEDNTVKIKFEGSFCMTCGINDWVIDFKYVIEDLNGSCELIKIIEPEDPMSREQWRIGIFHIKKIPEDQDSKPI